ncbi:MAG TPA: DoxX family protein [Gemmatimonadota bacterium]|nr:DoxX family protein [Gemmatimonadota bacterium]
MDDVHDGSIETRGLQGGVWTALRIAAGLAYFSHGAQKMLGWFGGFGEAGTAELMTEYGAAGMIELVGGALIVLGLFTRPAAFIASGEMAVAYFWKHAGRNDEIFWWENGGELVMVFSLLWLFFAVWGAGPFSLDAWRRKRSATAAGEP